MIWHSVRHNALVLGGFAGFCAAVIALTFQLTYSQIQHNEDMAQIRQISEIIPAHEYNNDILKDIVLVGPNEALGLKKPTEAYIARHADEPIGIILPVVAPDGYSGNIRLLVGIYLDGSLAGVRTVMHNETPGLGDKIDANKSDWIRQFDHQSLTSPQPKAWSVKKEGGAFDQLTGATISPRAVIKAVKRSLEYFQSHKASLLDSPLHHNKQNHEDSNGNTL